MGGGVHVTPGGGGGGVVKSSQNSPILVLILRGSIPYLFVCVYVIKGC